MKSITIITPYLVIVLLVFLAVIALIWLDYETKSWDDVIRLGNLLSGLLFYALPALLVVFFIFTKLKKILSVGVSIVVSVIVGIPTSFIIVIFLLKLFSELV